MFYDYYMILLYTLLNIALSDTLENVQFENQFIENNKQNNGKPNKKKPKKKKAMSVPIEIGIGPTGYQFNSAIITIVQIFIFCIWI